MATSALSAASCEVSARAWAWSLRGTVTADPVVFLPLRLTNRGEAETWGGSRSSLDVYGTLAAAGIYTYTVKRTDDLPRALGGRGELVAVEGGGS